MESNEFDFTAVDEAHQLIKDIVVLGFSGTNVSAGKAYGRLYALDSADSKYLSVAHQTLTTGSDTGKRIALVNFREIVQPPHFLVYDQDHTQRLRDLLLRRWCVGNVSEAIGHEDVDSLLEDADSALQTLVDSDQTLYNADRSAAYWHGVVTLINIVHPMDDDALKKAAPFILWAGNRSDWKEIIRVGRERSSTDPALIEAILTQGERITAPVKDGVL
jgi:hypothetical protein